MASFASSASSMARNTMAGRGGKFIPRAASRSEIARSTIYEHDPDGQMVLGEDVEAGSSIAPSSVASVAGSGYDGSAASSRYSPSFMTGGASLAPSGQHDTWQLFGGQRGAHRLAPLSEASGRSSPDADDPISAEWVHDVAESNLSAREAAHQATLNPTL